MALQKATIEQGVSSDIQDSHPQPKGARTVSIMNPKLVRVNGKIQGPLQGK